MTMRRTSLMALLAAMLLVFTIVPGRAIGPEWHARTPSFDCAKATRPDEKAICSNDLLAELDTMIATLYAMLWHYIENYDNAMGVLSRLRDSQRDFLKRRAACGADIRCIERVQRKRIDALLDDYKRGTTAPIIAPLNNEASEMPAAAPHK